MVSAFWTWTIATCTCKLAICYLYLDLFRIHMKLKRWLWLLMVLIACYAPIFIAFFMTQCRPVWAAWDQVLSETNCRPAGPHELASVAANLFLDLAVVLTPSPVIWKLHMPTRKKVGVSTMFSLGFS